MQHFSSNGVDIAFLDDGAGEPILLIHGFASNVAVNWGATGWIQTLRGAGRRVIAMDVRGHGRSAKLYDPEAYRLDLMVGDAVNLLDHLGIERADVMGYSMGARITAAVTIARPKKVRSAILGGIGFALVTGMGNEDQIAAALEAPDAQSVTADPGRAYRRFAEQTGSDLGALAACMRRFREIVTPEELATISVPVLIAVGERDAVAGSGEALARLIPGAELLIIANRDHMLATAAKPFKEAVIDFLARRP